MSRALTRTHLARPGALEAVLLRSGGAGLVIGTNRHSAPVAVQVFRPEPTRAVLVGSHRLAQVVVFRAIGAGAAVTVET
ncbi:MAG: hypothetical protein H7Y15_14170, partial [Pseudonocardia sp.]|nr:hypothetical protein [Pseudonocardia sp.]